MACEAKPLCSICERLLTTDLGDLCPGKVGMFRRVAPVCAPLEVACFDLSWIAMLSEAETDA
jgi:hypothetical protein